MRGFSISPCYSYLQPTNASIITGRGNFCRALNEHYYNNADKYRNNFYKRHQNKALLRQGLGLFFSSDEDSSNGKVLLLVGCGSGNTIFPLMAAHPKLYIHACDISLRAITLVKGDASEFKDERTNAFVCDVTDENLSTKINPSSVDVVTLEFMLSAISPKKMLLTLENIRSVLKLNGYILFRDYAFGDFSQVKLQEKKRKIGEDCYVRGDGTKILSSLFSRAGFKAVTIDIYGKQIENCSRNIIMDRLWIHAIFSNFNCTCNGAAPGSVLISEG